MVNTFKFLYDNKVFIKSGFYIEYQGTVKDYQTVCMVHTGELIGVEYQVELKLNKHDTKLLWFKEEELERM